MTETVGGHYERMLEVVVALDAHEVLAPEVAGRTIAAIGTVVEQRHAIGASCEINPTQTYLQVGECSRLVVVAISVVTLNPGDKLTRIDRMAISLDILFHPVGLFEVIAQVPAQARSRHAHVFGILLLLDILVLQHLTIDEETVLGHAKIHAIGRLATCGHGPEVVLGRLLVLRVTGQTDMLGRVVAETTHAALDQIVAILQVVGLEVGILSVDVGKTAHLASGALQTVVVVSNLIETRGMIEVLVSTHSCVEFVTYACVIDGSMVRQDIDDDADAIFAGFVAELLEFLTGTNHVVADLPIDRLVIIIPATMAKELRTTALITLGFDDTLLGRRGLNDGIAGFGNVGKVFADGVERPAPCMQNHVIVGVDRRNLRFA